MKINWIYVLWILLPVFGILYSIGTFFESFNNEIIQSMIKPFTDLWANLFASMIVVLLVDKIIRRTELQKSERSMRYVKGRIANTCSNLAMHMRPPSNWQILLKRDKFDWKDYFHRVLNYKKRAQVELDVILDKYISLIEPELRNDVFDILGLLSSWTWLALEEPTRCLEDDLWRLNNYAILTSALIIESTETMKAHKLLENVGPSIIFQKGEPSKLEFPSRLEIRVENQYLNYETSLKEAINLRDACNEKIRKHTEKMKKAAK